MEKSVYCFSTWYSKLLLIQVYTGSSCLYWCFAVVLTLFVFLIQIVPKAWGRFSAQLPGHTRGLNLQPLAYFCPPWEMKTSTRTSYNSWGENALEWSHIMLLTTMNSVFQVPVWWLWRVVILAFQWPLPIMTIPVRTMQGTQRCSSLISSFFSPIIWFNRHQTVFCLPMVWAQIVKSQLKQTATTIWVFPRSFDTT